MTRRPSDRLRDLGGSTEAIAIAQQAMGRIVQNALHERLPALAPEDVRELVRLATAGARTPLANLALSSYQEGRALAAGGAVMVAFGRAYLAGMAAHLRDSPPAPHVLEVLAEMLRQGAVVSLDDVREIARGTGLPLADTQGVTVP